MGVILCSKCDEMIDTVDTEKVTIYYGICDAPSCRQTQKAQEEACGNQAVRVVHSATA